MDAHIIHWIPRSFVTSDARSAMEPPFSQPPNSPEKNRLSPKKPVYELHIPYL